MNDDINAIIGIIPTAIKSKIDVVFKAMFDKNLYLTRFTSMKAAFRHILNCTAEIESTAAISAHIFSILVAKFSENNLFKPEVIVYMCLLIDQSSRKRKKLNMEQKKTEQEMVTALVAAAREKDKREREYQNKFGGLHENMRRVVAASGTSLRVPPGLGFKLTPENDYDMENRRLANVMDPANSNDVLNLKYYLSSSNYFGGSRLLEVGTPCSKMDATNKAYVDSAIRDNKTNTRTYMDMLTRDGEAAMRTHYTTYFDNANAEMGKIVEKINSVHYAAKGDINGIIAHIIPSVVKTMLLELLHSSNGKHSEGDFNQNSEFDQNRCRRIDNRKGYHHRRFKNTAV
ncbi:hypothetical protein FQA39_LY11850 [Lamprigera yunnana]|nr:hypothetical protein FQA39_LY11850 [Lamprigera yunnana]